MISNGNTKVNSFRKYRKKSLLIFVNDNEFAYNI